MSIFSRSFRQYFHPNHAILQRSAVEYFDMTAYISLIFNDGQRTLKASEIKEFSFSQSLDCYVLLISENKCSETKRIHKACKAEIEKLQLLLDDLIYEPA